MHWTLLHVAFLMQFAKCKIWTPFQMFVVAMEEIDK